MDYLLGLFLWFGHIELLLPLILGGLLIKRTRLLFVQITELVGISFISNVWLKSIFQVPLAEHLNKVGYALPSGHMQMILCIYGWLLLRNPIKRQVPRYCLALSILILFIGESCALIHFGYHELIDIMAAWVSGLVILCLYYYISKRLNPWYQQWLPLTSGVIMLVATHLITKAIIGEHAYIGLGILLTVLLLKQAKTISRLP